MNAHNDKTLEETINGAFGGQAKEFDFDAFKDRYPEQVEQYRLQTQGQMRRFTRFPRGLGLIAKLAVAAMLVVCLGLLLQNGQVREAPPEVVITEHPSSMMSVLALNRAYREGGLDAVDDQYEQAYAKLGPRTRGMSLGNVFTENL